MRAVPTPDPARLRRVDAVLTAKAIGELHYEEALVPEPRGAGYRLDLPHGVSYRFEGRRNPWGQVVPEPASLVRLDATGTPTPPDVCRFFVDAAPALGLSALVLGPWLEEVTATRFSDLLIAAAGEGVTADALLDMTELDRQALLPGHPKIIVCKGRMGWGLDDTLRYAPEAATPFQLYWVAVRRDACLLGRAPGLDDAHLLAASMDAAALSAFDALVHAREIDRDRFTFLPVHPWQWDRILAVRLAGEQASGDLHFLGAHGDRYRPLISLRTLVNVDRPGRFQVKLPITVRNTSCFRGLPARYIRVAPELSRLLGDICADDPLLRARGTRVLGEPAGTAYLGGPWAQTPGVPYRYTEMLGAVWRDAGTSALPPGDQAVMTGALYVTDASGRSLAAAAMDRAGCSAQAWVAAYTDAVVIPLYHLLCVYGVGLVAHGQNVSVVLRRGLPVGVVLKDLQGDLRLWDRDVPEAPWPEAVRTVLTRLPAHYLVHDLYTGHMVSVLRFLSGTLHREGLLPEPLFYRTVAEGLDRYLAAHPAYAARYAAFDLRRPTMERLLVNRVRFEIGYADREERPLPMMGSPLANPLHPSHPMFSEEKNPCIATR